MTDDPKPRDTEGLALREMSRVLDRDPELRALLALVKRHGPDMYLDLLTLADLDRKSRQISRRLTWDLAPDTLWVLMETQFLPADFDAWAGRDFSTLVHQAGITAGRQLSVATSKLTSTLIRETPGADAEKWRTYTRRAYHTALLNLTPPLDPKECEARGRQLIKERPELLETRR